MPTPTRVLPATAALGLTVTLLTGCGHEPAPAATSVTPEAAIASPDAGSTPTGSPSPTRATASRAPTRPAATGAPAKGPLLHGTGYRLHVPRGWRNVTGTLKVPGGDLAAGSTRPTHGYASNVVVVVPHQGFSSSDLDTVTRQIRAHLHEDAPHYRVHADTLVAGVPAGHLSGMFHGPKRAYWLEQYVTTHAGASYIISFSFSPDLAASRREAVMDEILASWRWQ